MQRRHGRVHPARVQHRPHVPVEEREQQAPDVSAVDVSVGVVRQQPTRPGDEILVVGDREVIYVAVVIEHFDLAYGQADERLGNPRVGSPCALGRNSRVIRVRAASLAPQAAEPRQLLFRGDDDCVARSRVNVSPADPEGSAGSLMPAE